LGDEICQKFEIRISKSERNSKFEFSKFQKLRFELGDWVIRICFKFGLPARSRFGEGRDLVLRIWIILPRFSP